MTQTATVQGEGSIDPILTSVNQAARALGITPMECVRLIESEDLAAATFNGRRLVSVASVRGYADRLLTQEQPA